MNYKTCIGCKDLYGHPSISKNFVCTLSKPVLLTELKGCELKTKQPPTYQILRKR